MLCLSGFELYSRWVPLVFLDLPDNCNEKCVDKTLFIKFSFFFQTTSGISGSTESIDLSCIHVSYVKLYIN